MREAKNNDWSKAEMGRITDRSGSERFGAVFGAERSRKFSRSLRSVTDRSKVLWSDGLMALKPLRDPLRKIRLLIRIYDLLRGVLLVNQVHSRSSPSTHNTFFLCILWGFPVLHLSSSFVFEWDWSCSIQYRSWVSQKVTRRLFTAWKREKKTGQKLSEALIKPGGLRPSKIRRYALVAL
jgi:hypothetical protein